MKRISEQIREAIAKSNKTRYRIAKESGIDESTLAKFFNGHAGLSMKALDRLGRCLGLRIISTKGKGR
jgi:transcriptional regulator with XRE-family HTH domain